MGKTNSNEYKYGVGLTIDEKSFRQVRKELKSDFDALKVLVKGFKEELKVDPDASLSRVFKQMREIKNVVDDINKSNASTGNFVNKGIITDIADIEVSPKGPL